MNNKAKTEIHVKTALLAADGFEEVEEDLLKKKLKKKK